MCVRYRRQKVISIKPETLTALLLKISDELVDLRMEDVIVRSSGYDLARDSFEIIVQHKSFEEVEIGDTIPHLARISYDDIKGLKLETNQH